ncbi:MAG: porin [Candidatus Puniceispirillaceae bacterium]
MRKVLFATTALVALGGVSAASADISVSGKASFTYTSGSGDGYASDSKSYGSTVDFGISGSSTLDNGMTVSGGLDLHETSASVIDDHGFSVAGDFGTLKFGGYAEDDFGSMAIDVTADEGNALTATYNTVLPGDEHIAASDVSLTLPSIGGATIMLGMSDGASDSADGTMAGVSYTMDAGGMGVTVGYASSSTGENGSDASQVAAKVTSGSATVMVISGTKGDYSNSGVGATYALNDSLTVQAYTGTTELDTNTSYEVKDTGIGFTYTVTPGMSVSVTSNDWSGKNGTAAQAEAGTTTKLALDVSF